MATFYEATRLKTRLTSALLRQPGIHGVGVGSAVPGQRGRGAAVIVYMNKGVSPAEVRRNVAKTMGYEVKVPIRPIASGQFRPHATMPKKRVLRRTKAPRIIVKQNPFRSLIRPVPGGVSIGRFLNNTSALAGTAGLITVANGQLFILSNNHVLVQANRFNPNIIQPSPVDGGRLADRIGFASAFVPLNVNGINFMDAAIATPFDISDLDPRYLVGQDQFMVLSGNLNTYQVGDPMVKSGRTTGFVEGSVESIGGTFRIGPYPELGNAILTFVNQTVIAGNNNSIVSLPGDSGSVWITPDGFAAALNFSGSGTRSIATPIATVLSTFGLQVAIPIAGGKFRAGKVKGFVPKGNYAYVRPLSVAARKRIRVVRFKRAK